ncbi:MAG: glycosyltransferase family 2 protein [Oscillospiraceae bacterium]|jgi:cellulose synthase/poly-beta-1,6-N-acetylglucosamine synthase-like glycosyltransferase|nr:glycosyltransferase family 2 protein [Oscillospiraceae bacterium]
MEIFRTFLSIFEVLLNLFSAYFVAVALFAARKPKPFANAPPRTRFAVLIPARNEEKVIAGLVRSLLAQDYPRALFDVFVIPNNCTDGTETAARAAGAEILRCAYPVRYKGDALREAFARLLPNGYDAFCVFDADNFVDPGFLAEMNRAFCSGARVCKSRLRAKNPYDSATAGCYAIYFETFNLLFHRARAACGLSANINGTGFAVSRDVIEALGGWNTSTITEDAEFAAQCALAGERVTWVPKAVTYDEEPNSPLLSVTQRRRWCSGIADVGRAKLPEALTARPKKGVRGLLYDQIMVLLAPFVTSAALIPAVFRALTRPVAATLLGFAAYYALVCLAAAALALAGGYRDRRIAKGVLMFPLFMASHLPIQAFSIFRRTTVWRAMPHFGATRVTAPNSAGIQAPRRESRVRRSSPRSPS